MMIKSHRGELTDFVGRQLTADPSLIKEFHNGRSLLHFAAASGSVELVKQLLDLGVASDVLDAGGHTPLYSMANQRTANPDIARMLIVAGANVNACGGVKRCTPLHMAARQGNEEVARVLLEFGADVNAKDTQGVTPLQRAINCKRANVAALLGKDRTIPTKKQP